MNTALWIVAGFLTALYLFSGLGKLMLPREKIARIGGPPGAWVSDFTPSTLKAIGTAEVLGGLGVTVPALVDVVPGLVPIAALGLVMLMTGAVITRIRRHEFLFMLVDLSYLEMAAFVAWGRFGPESFG